MVQFIKESQAASLSTAMDLEGSERFSPKKEKQIAVLHEIAKRHLNPVPEDQEFTWGDRAPEGLPPKATEWLNRPGLAKPENLIADARRFNVLRQHSAPEDSRVINQALREGNLT